jgi:hypothetical protein
MAKITGSDLPARAPQSEEEEEQYAAGNFPVLNDNKAPRIFQEEDLRGISNFDEAFAAAQEQFGDVVDASTAIGTGFSVLDTEAKNSLCGVPFIVSKWLLTTATSANSFLSSRSPRITAVSL